MASSVAQVKKGLRDFLRTTQGLRPADNVTVRSADIEDAKQFTTNMVLLGGVTVTHANTGLRGHAETPTMSCWLHAIKAGDGEDAIDAARDRADELMDLVEQAIAADPSAAGVVPPPGQLSVTSGGLDEPPVLWGDAAARRAVRTFSITWTSHS